MTVSSVDVGNVLVLVVGGALNHETAPELLPTIDEALDSSRTRFVIDLSQATEADSAGLEVLVSIASKVFRYGGRLGFFGATGNMAEILRVTRLEQRLATFPSREEALARIREED